MTNPVVSFIWYELMTTDPEGAAAFYGPVVGWKIVGHSDPQSAADGMDYRMIERSDGGTAGGVCKLAPQMCEGGARPCWIGYHYVTDVDAATQAITADGGKVLMPAFDIEVGRIAMVTDPQDVPHYVMTPRPPAGAPADARSDVYDRQAEQRVGWNELMSPDLAGAKAFYARHYKFEFNEIQPWAYHKLPEVFGGKVGYEVRTEGQFDAALNKALADTSGPSLIHVHLDRDDHSTSLERLTERLSKRV